MTTKYRTYALRLDEDVAVYYEGLAATDGIRPSKLFQKILTNNFQSVGIKHQADRIEQLVDDFERKLKFTLEKFQNDNSLNEKYFEDFGGIYMMLLGVLMKQNVVKDEIKEMQSKGAIYAKKNFIGEQS
ncbi:hypothetical protein [Acinetobacter beijerinckii]|uniref:Uncharacterized protein n=1 Tax=Acinetobacter beijerinckii CIP 110307 TaxID=1217648 RepID=N9F6J4_9GAMM|nr:hypothetical protein [Acinetobacter beijerinckii]ENW02935.1 hypothetical protein F933_03341 [Acinetobacter beijerinckii CIP 110307]